MAKSRRNRARRSRRRAPFREPLPVVLIVCEGERTEPQYFEGFREACRNPRVHIKISSEHGVPKTLVDTAKRLKSNAEQSAKRERDDNLRYDSIWCVFDIDDHRHVNESQAEARQSGIELAISNPCFELWLLLHFREPPGVQTREKIRRLLKGHVSDYDKHVDYKRYMSGYDGAVERAKRLDRQAQEGGEPGRNPTTGVYRLSELIRAERSP